MGTNQVKLLLLPQLTIYHRELPREIDDDSGTQKVPHGFHALPSEFGGKFLLKLDYLIANTLNALDASANTLDWSRAGCFG